ncbi:uncharacterized protein [Penaeus vannamei]|uniref:uncharacterized protein n=1 Tax=Penaeus vannamei TaxID=6689 RepID=UPI00387FA751
MGARKWTSLNTLYPQVQCRLSVPSHGTGHSPSFSWLVVLPGHPNTSSCLLVPPGHPPNPSSPCSSTSSSNLPSSLAPPVILQSPFVSSSSRSSSNLSSSSTSTGSSSTHLLTPSSPRSSSILPLTPCSAHALSPVNISEQVTEQQNATVEREKSPEVNYSSIAASLKICRG